MKEKIEKIVFDFFVSSRDFNGIPLRKISAQLKIGYKNSIDLIIALVTEDKVSIQSSTNPHIIGFQHYPIDIQIKILEEAKNLKESREKIGAITFVSENSQFPICLYPSKNYLETKRDLTKFNNLEYTRRLALGEPHLKAAFFEIEVLERYYTDPRFNFKFDDYSGRISCKSDENGNPILKEEDQIFIDTFGLGFDNENNRLAVVYLRYLTGLTSEHQTFWKSKEIKGECKILEEYYQNTILGNWAFSHSVFSAFIGELNRLNLLSEKIFKEKLFLQTFENNNRPKEFTFFFVPTSKNYDEFILLLDKMISDNINKGFFSGKVELYDIEKLSDNTFERKPKGTLRLLEEWLVSKFNSPDPKLFDNIFKPLRSIRKERQNPAHRISKNVYNREFTKMQKETLDKAYISIKSLRTISQKHPEGKILKYLNG